MAKKQALVVESNLTRAKTLCFLLCEMADCEAIHTPTVMGALREIKARSIDLVMTNTNLQKEKDGHANTENSISPGTFKNITGKPEGYVTGQQYGQESPMLR